MNIKENLSKISYIPLILLTILDFFLATVFLSALIIVIVVNNPTISLIELNDLLFTNTKILVVMMFLCAFPSFIATFLLSRIAKKNFAHNCAAFYILEILSLVVIVIMAPASEHSFPAWFYLLSTILWTLLVIYGSYLGYKSYLKKSGVK